MLVSASFPEFAALRKEIAFKRDLGEVILEVKKLTPVQNLQPKNLITDIDLFVVQLGYHPLGENWREINRQKAEEILTFSLTKDLAYSSPLMSEQEAKAIIGKLLNLFPGEPQFFTNLSNINSNSIMSAWNSLTNATFDTGVVMVSNDLLGLLWFKDED